MENNNKSLIRIELPIRPTTITRPKDSNSYEVPEDAVVAKDTKKKVVIKKARVKVDVLRTNMM